VLCVVLEQKSVEQEDGYWTLAPPSAASLVTLDAQTGAVLGTEDLPPRTGGTAENGVLYLASLAEDATTLTVTASDALTGAQRWTGTLPVDGGDWSQSDLALRAPSVRVDRGHLVVDSIPVTWVIDPSDGTVEMTGSIGMGISRTGLVVESSSATQMFDLDGTVLLSEAAAPAGLAVDDGSVPDLEILVSQSQSTARTLTAVDPRTGRTAWTLERTGWQDAGMILLDDVLYGTTTRSAWAVDATTGRELWSAEALTASGTQAVTDGENLLVTTWGPADGPDGTVENRYLLTALRLSDGATLWSTALPDGLQAVWSVGGDLVGFTEDGGLRVLD
jgi:outer membrane protein assembly factor BamB